MTSMDGVVFEKQRFQLCALHCLNCLLQDSSAFSKASLDEICWHLCPNRTIFNPHRSWLGLGNYDVNVILFALQSKGYKGLWFDQRRSLNQVETESLLGFILNVPAPTFKFLNFLRPCVDRRHWISFRRIEGNFYNFDSLQNSPSLIGSDEDMISYLSRELKLPDRNLILVVADDVDDV